jgi:hypothetical protein
MSNDTNSSPGVTNCAFTGNAAVNNTALPTALATDLDGNPRSVDDPLTSDTGNGLPPIVDMGAYEFQADPLLCVPADFNCDGSVDEDGLAILADCATGANLPYDPQNLPLACPLEPDAEGIIAADLDRDGDVDHDDFAIFQRCYGGPGNPPSPVCLE